MLLNSFANLKISFKNFTQNFKELYFLSNYYDQKISRKVNIKFYFFPNPYLMTSLIKYQNFSFHLVEAEENYWSKIDNLKTLKSASRFKWLNAVNRKVHSSHVQKIIHAWIKRNNKYNKTLWAADVIFDRVLSWLFNGELILKNSDLEFQNIFYGSLNKQINHIRNIPEKEIDYIHSLKKHTTLLITSVVIQELDQLFENSTKNVLNILEDYFDDQGILKSKNIDHLMVISKYLILIEQICHHGQKHLPDELNILLEKIINNIFVLKNPSGLTPLFMGATDKNLEVYFDYLKSLNYKKSPKTKNFSNLILIKSKKNIIYFDLNEPPKKSHSSFYQNGPLAFEYYYDKDKVITNCGFGINISDECTYYSRLTSAQSTLCLNQTTVSKFNKSSIKNFYSPILSSFKIFDKFDKETDFTLTAGATHNGYKKKYGYEHKRVITLNKVTESLYGEDSLINVKEDENRLNFNIRFHLYPETIAIKTMGDKGVIIKLNSGKSFVFKCDDCKLEIENGLFFGRKTTTKNLNINLIGMTNNKVTNIKWSIEKGA